MYLYAWMNPEHANEFDRTEKTAGNPLGLLPNERATKESLRDYFNYTAIVTNYKPLSFEEVEEGLRFDRLRLAKRMVELFERSAVFSKMDPQRRQEVEEYFFDDTREESPWVHI